MRPPLLAGASMVVLPDPAPVDGGAAGAYSRNALPAPPPLAVLDLREPAPGAVEATVALGAALFDGHFPGHPTLSAVAQIAVVEAALAAWKGAALALAGVESMRLTRRVAGGSVQVHLAGAERLLFSLRTAAELVSTGAATITGEPNGPASGHEPGGTASGRGSGGTLAVGGSRGAGSGREPGDGGPGDAAEPFERLPHAGVARMLEGVLARDGERIVCRARLDPGSPFAGLGRAGGQAPSWVAIEMAAQAAAALELAEPAAGDGPWRGYLVRLRGVRCLRPELPVGAPVRLEVTRRAAVATLRTYGVLAFADSEAVLSGELSLFFEPSG